jgi:hypothetical protein
MTAPLRFLRLADDLTVYVSDTGCVVIQQDAGHDMHHVCIDPDQVAEFLSAVRVLGESAAAKQAAVLAASDAEYRAAFGGDA